MRILFCAKCVTLDEIPDYEGNEAVDPLVEAVVMRHNERDPLAHGGQRTGMPHNASPMRLFPVKDTDWFDPENDYEKRKKIIEVINQENKTAGLDAWVYDSFSTYREDAMKCYRQHNRPAGACTDWWAENKRIGRPTEEGRSLIEDPDYEKLAKSEPHLCQFCPVMTFVQTSINSKKGFYNK